MNLRGNWRVVLLAVFVVLSGVALFAPTGGGAGGNATNDSAAVSTGPTNLQYGLELSGGTRLRAPLVGLTAEDVAVTPDNEQTVEETVADQLAVSSLDVQARPGATPSASGTVEVFNENVTEEEFVAALQAANLSATTENVRSGVTDQTMQTAVEVLDRKIRGAGGFSGGDAAVVTSATGESFVLVEVPGKSRSEVLDLVGDRGQVAVVAHFPDQNGSGYRNVLLFTQEGIADVQPVRQDSSGQPVVPIRLTESAAQEFSDAMRQYGFTGSQGVLNCQYERNPDDAGYCLFTVVGGGVVNNTVQGEIVYEASVAPSLAETINNGDFVKDPRFQTSAPNTSAAQNLRLNLQAGALPAELDVDSGTSYFLQPSLAQEFKTFSVVTGFFAVLAVAGVVFLRYRELGVAIPMLLTAAAEVFILLGFAAAVGLALDLSHIAGFIAVIGTGVDDLIIIADEILQEGEVRTGKVFESRFRKAFWVIGAAAATTIVAMSPLAVLSLGDLQGFALVTIVGVLIGVLVTRPAYGNILRNVVLD
ncbi:preprotein translocase subunit SecD [Halomarina litorea]|uniref:preprotein translocase subunit SecD n=1 Tax=Halomarina litorea TaxID=2961595 RepID=UPI0020C582E8|nr:preprotein translocase subunit SecD [Halomarina sp. BCD28]